MPRTNIGKPKAPKVNYLASAIKSYKKANGLNDSELGKALGLERVTVCKKINKPPDKWTIGELIKFSAAVKMPLSVALDAVKDWYEKGN